MSGCCTLGRYTNTSLWSNQPFSSWPSILIFMFFLYLDLCKPHINATSTTTTKIRYFSISKVKSGSINSSVCTSVLAFMELKLLPANHSVRFIISSIITQLCQIFSVLFSACLSCPLTFCVQRNTLYDYEQIQNYI